MGGTQYEIWQNAKRAHEEAVRLLNESKGSQMGTPAAQDLGNRQRAADAAQSRLNDAKAAYDRHMNGR